MAEDRRKNWIKSKKEKQQWTPKLENAILRTKANKVNILDCPLKKGEIQNWDATEDEEEEEEEEEEDHDNRDQNANAKQNKTTRGTDRVDVDQSDNGSTAETPIPLLIFVVRDPAYGLPQVDHRPELQTQPMEMMSYENEPMRTLLPVRR